VHAETLRRWRKEAGLWQRQRRQKPYRQRREAKAHFGEQVQLDGSFHEWLEERGPESCFMYMVDDATTKGLGQFSEQETTLAADGERGQGRCPFPRAPIPKTAPQPSSRSESSLETSLAADETPSLFRDMVKTQPGDISIVV